MEYCEYILSKNNIQSVQGFIEKGKVYYLWEFREKLNQAINSYKAFYNVKEKNFSNEQMLIKSLERFFEGDIIFLKHHRDDVINKLYKNTKELFKNEKETYKKNKTLSYDNMFEVITNFAILCSNTLINVKESQNNKDVIHYKTVNINIVETMEMLDSAIKLTERFRKSVEFTQKREKRFEKLPKPIAIVAKGVAPVAPIAVPAVGPLIATGFNTKWLWDYMQSDSADKDVSLFMYLWCVLAVTYTINENMKGSIDYGW